MSLIIYKPSVHAVIQLRAYLMEMLTRTVIIIRSVNMTYKPNCEKDRVALFKYVLDLNMPDRKKKKVFNRLYEEYRITHEMYKDIDNFISGIIEEDLRGFKQQDQ